MLAYNPNILTCLRNIYHTQFVVRYRFYFIISFLYFSFLHCFHFTGSYVQKVLWRIWSTHGWVTVRRVFISCCWAAARRPWTAWVPLGTPVTWYPSRMTLETAIALCRHMDGCYAMHVRLRNTMVAITRYPFCRNSRPFSATHVCRPRLYNEIPSKTKQLVLCSRSCR
jgi:hypothetical protein